MFSSRGLIPLALVAFFTLSSFAPQEEQWTEYLGKPFDSVISALRTQYPHCDTHHVSPGQVVVASCMPYEFIGEKGLLVLRSSKKGIITTCSWIRGEHPSIKGILDNIDSSNRSQLALKFGDLDRIFNALWTYYDNKMGATFTATDDGSYLWKPEQLQRKNIEYTMTRSLGYIEFSVSLRNTDPKGKKNPKITGK